MGWSTDWGKYPAQWGADVPDGGDSSVPSQLNSRTKLGTAVLKHSGLRYNVLQFWDAMVTFGAMRVRDVLVYCRDHRFSHHIETNADGWADDMRPSDIEPKFTCTKRPARTGTNGDGVRFFASDGLAT